MEQYFLYYWDEFVYSIVFKVINLKNKVYQWTNFGWDGAGELITQMSVSLIPDDMDMINKCPRVLENLSYRWAADS